MPRYNVIEEWLKRTDTSGRRVNEWCSTKDSDQNHLFCKICSTSFSTKGKGFQAVTQHAETEKHKNNARTKLDPLQLTLQKTQGKILPTPAINKTTGTPENSAGAEAEGETSTIQLFSRKFGGVAAELQWAMKCVQSAFSCNSCENVVPLFQCMFHDSNVAKDMSLGRTKVTYLITDALGPFFHDEMLEDVHVAHSFTLCFDETVNNKKVKELQFRIRYWSEKSNGVVDRHLETIFIGSATGVILTGHVMAVLERASLVLRRFLMLSSDGPNVNKTVFRLVNEKVRDCRGKSLLDAGTCNLHIMHNSFLCGLEEFGEEVSDFVTAVFDNFDGFPSRFEEYEKSQSLTKVPIHNFIVHVKSRWLTLSDSAERILEQWPALLHYFLSVILKSSSGSHKKIRESQRYKCIKTALNDPVFPSKIAFVIQSAKLFEKFSKLFQKSEPMIHLLYDELCSLYVLLLGRFCKTELVSTSRNCLKEDFFTNKDNLVPLKQVDCGERAATFLNECKEADILQFKLGAQKHYQAAARHLLKKSVLGNWPDGKHLRCLQPDHIKDPGSSRSIVLAYKMLHLDLGVDEDFLKDEWRLLQLEVPASDPDMRIDYYWRQIFSMTGLNNEPKFPNISKVVKATLPIAHGNADVERGFSESKQQLQPNQARMKERLFNAKLWVRDGLKTYDGRPDFVPMTRKLLSAGRTAYRKYEEYMQEQRDEEAARARKQAEDEDEQRKRKTNEQQQRADRETIANLEKKLEEKQEAEREQRKAADQLLEDATKKLENALKKNDMIVAKVAQGMLAGAKAMRERAEEYYNESAPLQKKVKRKTSTLLEKLFHNHTGKKRKGPENHENPDDPDPAPLP